MFMQPLSRGSKSRLRLLLQSRNLHTADESLSSRFPSQIGGVHYQIGDRVLLTSKDGKRVKSRLASPLKPGGSTKTGLHSYEIKHDEIIGKPASRLYVKALSTNNKDKNTAFRVAHPSLEQFVALAPRTVTPIYSSYGATIVALLDLHVAPPIPSNDPRSTGIPPLEILEAGTGNGGLTLHLARAIAAANPPPPHYETDCAEETLSREWEEWRSQRRAIIHTVEFLGSRSRAAEKLIKSFRGALYWPHIDFHSGDVGAWVSAELDRRRQVDTSTHGFLDVVILDLPAVHKQVPRVVEAMKEDAQLVVWVPQITQVAACQQQIESLNLPLKLDQVTELGEGISNGRRWDLRFVKPRSEQGRERTESHVSTVLSHADETEEIALQSDDGEAENASPAVEDQPLSTPTDFPTMVCRPMVGEMIVGGGFVGLWRKVTRTNKDSQ